ADGDQGHLQQGHDGRVLVVVHGVGGHLPQGGRQAEVPQGQADVRAARQAGGGQDLRHLAQQREVRQLQGRRRPRRRAVPAGVSDEGGGRARATGAGGQ